MVERPTIQRENGFAPGFPGYDVHQNAVAQATADINYRRRVETEAAQALAVQAQGSIDDDVDDTPMEKND
jgi:hypothetical protein